MADGWLRANPLQTERIIPILGWKRIYCNRHEISVTDTKYLKPSSHNGLDLWRNTLPPILTELLCVRLRFNKLLKLCGIMHYVFKTKRWASHPGFRSILGLIKTSNPSHRWERKAHLSDLSSSSGNPVVLQQMSPHAPVNSTLPPFKTKVYLLDCFASGVVIFPAPRKWEKLPAISFSLPLSLPLTLLLSISKPGK